MTTQRPTVLHYVGYDDDRGGIVSVARALAGAEQFSSILGVNTGCTLSGHSGLAVLELPRLEGETIGLANLWRAQTVARDVQRWLREDVTRIFHGHSRAGLLVALWLVRWGERRVVVSVHCYGKQRWFYRWASDRLGGRMYLLTPAMRRYYGISGEGWTQCIPSCIRERAGLTKPREVLRSGCLRVGGVGMLVEWKGWHLVLDALAALPIEVAERIQFTHIGSENRDAKSRNYAAMLRERGATFEQRVVWLGERENSSALLGEIDVLVLPSYNEPFSLAMIEALYVGVPVLRADSGGAVNLIEPGMNGWLFRTGDAGDLARVLRSLVETDALAKVRIDHEGLRRFTAPVVAAQWAEVYDRL